jgi:hypothetical protein
MKPSKHNPLDELVLKGLACVVKVKEGTLHKTNFDVYAKNVEAILINPTWNTTGKKSKVEGAITPEDFASL